MHGVEGNPSSPQRIPSDKLFRRLQSFRFDTCNSGSQGVVVQGGANEQHRSRIRWENLLLPRGLERGFISPPPNLSLFAPEDSGERFAKTHKNCFGFKPFRTLYKTKVQKCRVYETQAGSFTNFSLAIQDSS